MEDRIEEKREVKTKHRLHARNRHRKPYDFDALIKVNIELEPYVSVNQYGNQSIDFFSAAAVYQLNRALILSHYNLEFWDITSKFLCPPVPGRANYIHYVADLLGDHNCGRRSCHIPIGEELRILDIGSGANCIYPLIGNAEYGWSFVGSEMNEEALGNAAKIIDNNGSLKKNVTLRKQEAHKIFKNIFAKDEYFDATMCNPPFFESQKAANKATKNKLKKLSKSPSPEVDRNFSGTADELWTKGGELSFINQMIKESSQFADSCFWFTTLVSKESHLKNFYASLRDVNAIKVKTIKMNQGQKSSRILAWTFLSQNQQTSWADLRWKK